MTTDQWDQVQVLFEQAVELSSDEREAFLEKACKEDPALKAEVQSLLECDRLASTSFMTPPPPDAEALAAIAGEQADELLGSDVGPYRVERVIASGGMGTVYEALQREPVRPVALKIMHQQISSARGRRRFQFESQVLARLQHPNIAQVFEAGTHSGERGAVPYFAMEYIRGAKAITAFAEDRVLDINERLVLFAKVCDAVHHGHQKGIIHRDLKPENILVDERGEPKVIDFGVARSTDSDMTIATQHTREGMLVGTMQYMSPEQCDGKPDELDTRSDVYALGVVLFELLTGALPYEATGTSIYQAARTIKEAVPCRMSSICPKLCGDIEAVVMKALEKDRDRRYASAAELAEDIRRCASNEPVRARRPSALYLISKFAKRNKAATASMVLATLTLLAATIIALSYAAEATRQQSVAMAERYAAIMVGAESALRSNDPGSARRLLEQVEPNARAWEWQHFWSRLDLSERTLADLGPLARPDRIAIGCEDCLLAVTIANAPEVAIYDFQHDNLRRLRSLSTEACKSTAAAFNDDGGVLAVAFQACGSKDCIIELRKTTEESGYGIIDTWRFPAGGVTSLAFHPTRPILASTGEDLLIWDLADRSSPKTPIAAHTFGTTLEGLAFDPCGDLLAVACTYLSCTRIVDVDRFAAGRDCEIARLDHDYHVLDVAFSPDGSRLATASMDRTIRLWEVDAIRQKRTSEDPCVLGKSASVEPLEVLYGHVEGVTSVAFNPSGNGLVSGGYDRALRFWEVEPSKRPADTEGRFWSSLRGHEDTVRDVAILSDGRVLSAAWDGTVKLWSPGVEDVQRIRGFESSISAAAFCNNGARVVAVDGHGTRVLWDVAARSVQDRTKLSQAFRAVDLCCWMHDDRTYVAIATGMLPGATNCITIWDVDDWREPVCRIPSEIGGEGISFQSVAASSSGCRLAGGDGNGSVYVWNVANLPRVESIATLRREHTEPVNSVQFLDPDGTWLASASGNERGSSSHAIRIWKCTPDSQTVASTAVDEEHTDAILDLALSADGTMLASASNDQTARIWSVETRGESLRLVPKLILTGHTDGLRAVAFHPNGQRIATGSSDRLIKVWDTQRGLEVATLRGHTGQVLRLQFEPSGRCLISASSGGYGMDNVVRVWDTISPHKEPLGRESSY
jgi:WD40 repeat protein/serine/threonine protein kinase